MAALGLCLGVEQALIAGKLVRLRVIARSDSGYDQTAKLAVRDAVLSAAELYIDGCGDARTAAARLRESLPEIAEAAAKEAGDWYGETEIAVTLGAERCPSRDYGSFALPAGAYTTLKVELGEARGQNWWCVVFPPLCTGAATAEDMEAMGFDRAEAGLLTQKGGYVIKFRAVELWESLMGWLGLA